MNETAKQLTPLETFRQSLTSDVAQQGIKKMLPTDVDADKFTAVVMRAVQEDPKVLEADRKSLFMACQRAAQDGLIPDKREGALVIRNVKNHQTGQWTNQVAWQVMIGGIRKQLARCGFDIRAEIVYENDHFEHELGDNAGITHRRPQLGTERGPIVGAYAIATNLTTGRLYREVMTLAELEEIRETAKTDYVWAAWLTEMYRKTVARRLAKFLPVTGDEVDRLNQMLVNDNSHFTLDNAEATDTAKSVQKAARAPEQLTEQPAMPMVKSVDTNGHAVEVEAPKPKKKVTKKKATKKVAAKKETAPPPEPVEVEVVDEGPPPDDPDDPGF
jgi:phage RecT family recombinase